MSSWRTGKRRMERREGCGGSEWCSLSDWVTWWLRCFLYFASKSAHLILSSPDWTDCWWISWSFLKVRSVWVSGYCSSCTSHARLCINWTWPMKKEGDEEVDEGAIVMNKVYSCEPWRNTMVTVAAVVVAVAGDVVVVVVVDCLLFVVESVANVTGDLQRLGW